ncbi:CAP domain-containing protein, partial [Mycobacterium tuberculosis]
RRFIGLAGENIVELKGGPPSTAGELADLWRGSPGHRANMLRAAYTHVGFGVARKGDRTVGAAAFGESYAELAAPLAFRVGGLGAVGEVLARGSPVRGFALNS